MQAFGHQPAGNKISKVRWENGQNFTDRELLFATGSWDEGKDNLLKLWSCEAPGVPRMDVKEYKAVEQTRIQHSGDVTDIHFLEDELIITASSFGSVNLFKIQKDEEAEKIEYALEHRKTLPLHKYTTGGTASCTGIAIQPFSGNGGDIVSCGEDGKINLFSIDEEKPRETIAADGMALNSIAWISSHLIATTTNGGQLKLYDIRDLRKPSAIYSDSSNQNVALTCMAIHPSQANKLCTGSANGHITTWDIRNQEIPESNPFSVHSSYVWEVKYHPNSPGKIISCSNDGMCSILSYQQEKDQYGYYTDDAPTYQKLSSVFNPLSINSIDYHANASLLLGGNDSENLLWYFE